MNAEPTSFTELLEQRRVSVQETLRTATDEELVALNAQLFPDGQHPWAEAFRNFVQEHKAERALRGETSDGYAFIYYPTANRGIWYRHLETVQGVGILSETSLKALAEIVRGHTKM